MARRNISTERKGLYYVGMGLTIVGFLLFLSTFVTFLLHFGDFTDFAGRARSNGLRAFGGIVLIILGSVVRTVGARGLAGSGVVLDPEKAREDVEPWSRMAGGMVGDALDEAGIDLSGESSERSADMPFDEKLRRLHQLREDGILSEEEYRREKQEILDQN